MKDKLLRFTAVMHSGLTALLLAASLVGALTAVSCNGEKNKFEKYKVYFMKGDTVDYTATKTALVIISDVRWNITVRYENEELSGQWCTVKRTAGINTEEVSVTFEWNRGAERTAVFTVDFGDRTTTLRLVQKAFRAIPEGIPYWNELPDFDRVGVSDIMTVAHFVPGMGDIRNFTICYDTKNHYPIWVAYPMHTSYYEPAGQRSNAWQYDPKIPEQFQPNLSNTIRNYTRGHMLASASRYINKGANEQTFYYTNMTCQSSGFNGLETVWTNLESLERRWGGSRGDTLYCVSGAVLQTVGGNEHVSYTKARNDDKSIAVPNYFYKALAKRYADGSWRGIAFWFRHENAWRPVAAADAISIRELEGVTGIDFFTNLPADVQDKIENEREPSRWGI